MMFMQEQVLKEVCKIEIQRLEKKPRAKESGFLKEDKWSVRSDE